MAGTDAQGTTNTLLLQPGDKTSRGLAPTPLPGTADPTLAQGSRHKVEQGSKPCCGFRSGSASKRGAGQGSQRGADDNSSGKGTGLHGAQPRARQGQLLLPSSGHRATAPCQGGQSSGSYGGPGPCSTGLAGISDGSTINTEYQPQWKTSLSNSISTELRGKEEGV